MSKLLASKVTFSLITACVGVEIPVFASAMAETKRGRIAMPLLAKTAVACASCMGVTSV